MPFLPMINRHGGFYLFWNGMIDISILFARGSLLIYKTINPFELNERIILCCVFIPRYLSNKFITW